jgi:hypothetical protein
MTEMHKRINRLLTVAVQGRSMNIQLIVSGNYHRTMTKRHYQLGLFSNISGRYAVFTLNSIHKMTTIRRIR